MSTGKQLTTSAGGEVLLDDENAAAALWSIVAPPKPAQALTPKGSGRNFPSDLHSQMGLASAMVAMQVGWKLFH